MMDLRGHRYMFLQRRNADARPTVELEAQYLPLMSASACFAYCTALSCTFVLFYNTCSSIRKSIPTPVMSIVKLEAFDHLIVVTCFACTNTPALSTDLRS